MATVLVTMAAAVRRHVGEHQGVGVVRDLQRDLLLMLGRDMYSFESLACNACRF